MQAGSETRGGWPGIVLVWVLALVGAVLVVVLAYSGVGEWMGDATALGVYGALGMVFAASVILAMIVQLLMRRPDGLVTRLSTSLAGAAVVMLLAAVVVTPTALG
jgi:hypothetical protein